MCSVNKKARIEVTTRKHVTSPPSQEKGAIDILASPRTFTKPLKVCYPAADQRTSSDNISHMRPSRDISHRGTVDAVAFHDISRNEFFPPETRSNIYDR